MSFKTAGVPFSHVAAATNASVESRYACPTAILQSTSIVRTSNGSASSQAPAPTASAFSRTTCGTSIIDTDPDQLGDDIFERPRSVDLVRARGAQERFHLPEVDEDELALLRVCRSRSSSG